MSTGFHIRVKHLKFIWNSGTQEKDRGSIGICSSSPEFQIFFGVQPRLVHIPLANSSAG